MGGGGEGLSKNGGKKEKELMEIDNSVMIAVMKGR